LSDLETWVTAHDKKYHDIDTRVYTTVHSLVHGEVVSTTGSTVTRDLWVDLILLVVIGLTVLFFFVMFYVGLTHVIRLKTRSPRSTRHTSLRTRTRHSQEPFRYRSKSDVTEEENRRIEQERVFETVGRQKELEKQEQRRDIVFRKTCEKSENWFFLHREDRRKRQDSEFEYPVANSCKGSTGTKVAQSRQSK
jgi:hypothetical protein